MNAARLCLAFTLITVARLAAQTATLPAIAAASNPEVGFVSMFDGASLIGWDGDPKYWRVENGVIVGEITPETIVKRNTFLIWRGGTPANFELKVDYRVSDRGNSGINYRSVELTDAAWSLAGYQADIDGPSKHTGQNYEERGRTFLARRGEMVVVDAKGKPTVIASLGDPEALKAFVKTGDEWNSYHLIVNGHVLTHILNGHVMSVVMDEDEAHRRSDGLIGVQVHVGPPMKIEYKNFRIKLL